MEFLKFIYSNGLEVGVSMLLANWSAQTYKAIAYAIKNKVFNYSILFSTGRMPSSHSSTVTAMATSVGIISGWTSVIFAVSCCIAGIVMYDAAGVRRAASRQARVLNKLIKEFITDEEHKLKKVRLKQFIGHTPKEVIVGALLGVAVGFGLHYLLEYSI